MTTIDSWQKRWNALESTLDPMTAPDGETADPSFQTLSRCLHVFGESQFRFFHEGFAAGTLLPSMHYPIEHVLRATLDQVANDIAVIQAAAAQRRHGTSAMKETLDKADQLAQMALNLATNNDLLPANVARTYFNKAANIGVIPYAPMALIAIPFTCQTTPRDFLATPHEVGHYVYHHAPALASDLHLQTSLHPRWAAGWLEEIFADVYGCLVAGPVLGLDFQDLLLDNSLEHFLRDDGKHPVDAIRPYGYTAVLQKLGFRNATRLLEDRWQQWLERRNSPSQFTSANGATVDLAEARQAVEDMATTILHYLTQTRGVAPGSPWSTDTRRQTGVSQIEQLYDDFAAWVGEPLNAPVYQLVSDGSEVQVTGEDSELHRQRLGATHTWRDWLKTRTPDAAEAPLPPQAWMPVFTAGYWPDKGPEGNGNGSHL